MVFILLKKMKNFISELQEELKHDDCYYKAWQANIAMSFKDSFYWEDAEFAEKNSELINKVANKAAKYFLDN